MNARPRPRQSSMKKVNASFNFEPGQAIMMNVPVFNGGSFPVEIGQHPWLILRQDDECLVAVLCRTGRDASLNKNYSDKIWDSLMRGGGYEAGNGHDLLSQFQHPPFSEDLSHTTYVDMDNVACIPKVAVLEMKNAFAMSDGKTMNPTGLKREVDIWKRLGGEYDDPFNYLDFDRDWSVETYMKQVGEGVQNNQRCRQESFACEAGDTHTYVP